MFGLSGDCDTIVAFLIPREEHIVLRVSLLAVAVKAIVLTRGSKLDTSPSFENSTRKESPL